MRAEAGGQRTEIGSWRLEGGGQYGRESKYQILSACRSFDDLHRMPLFGSTTVCNGDIYDPGVHREADEYGVANDHACVFRNSFTQPVGGRIGCRDTDDSLTNCHSRAQSDAGIHCRDAG